MKKTKAPAKAIPQHKGMAMGKKAAVAPSKAPVMMKKGGKVKAKCK